MIRTMSDRRTRFSFVCVGADLQGWSAGGVECSYIQRFLRNFFRFPGDALPR